MQNTVSSARAKRRREKEMAKDSRRVHGLPAMTVMVPFIMVNRIGSMNLMTDRFAVTKLEKYLKEKKAEGMENISMMHLLIAAYVRLVSQRPALNRFIRGQRIWTRRSVEISLTIKKEMSLSSPDTVVKVIFQPDCTVRDVYESLNKAICDYRDNPGGDFDETAGGLARIPSLFLKFTIWLLRMLDYFGKIPKALTKVSPFHCSMFITSMGSLGIPAIYHHLYDFGTCPLFIAFGAKKREYKVNPDGSVYKEQYIDISFACDERICDGFYYGSALKLYKHILKNPSVLDAPPDEVIPDIY